MITWAKGGAALLLLLLPTVGTTSEQNFSQRHPEDIPLPADTACTAGESTLRASPIVQTRLSLEDVVTRASVHLNGRRWLVGVHRSGVRTGPSVRCPRVVPLRRACEVIEIARSGDWILVDTTAPNARGWIPAQHVLAATLPEDLSVTYHDSNDVLTVGSVPAVIRAGSGINYNVRATLAPGAKLRMLKRMRHWVAVESIQTGMTGWVFEPLTVKHPEHLARAKAPAPAHSPANQSIGERWVVLERSVDVKLEPNRRAATSRKLSRGTEVTGISMQGEWLQIVVPGSESAGWVHANGLELTRVVAAGAAAFIERLNANIGMPRAIGDGR